MFSPVAVLRQIFGFRVYGGTMPVWIASGLAYFAHRYKIIHEEQDTFTPISLLRFTRHQVTILN